MNELATILKIYFIGIGGIGMSALARYFHFHGKQVSGYDKTATALTLALEVDGIAVHYEEDLSLAPKDADVVVYTPAVPADHVELSYYRNNGYRLLKRSEMLGMITASSFNICVAGTHGKTTISTLIAHILRHTGYGCNAFLGGIAVNYDTNYWSSERNVCVIEADEYDRSFLRLSPDRAVISAMDADHLDIYGTAISMEDAFIEFTSKVKPGGAVYHRYALQRAAEFRARKISYARERSEADIYSQHVRVHDGGYRFDVHIGGISIEEVQLNMGGLHNVENATVAIGIAHELDIDKERIKTAVAAFRGVKRRFEYIIRSPELVFIDDYAHHPEELKALIQGARDLFKGRELTVIFQPHLFTRTRDFADEFALVLDEADEVILLPIYPARESPIEGVDSGLILQRLKKAKSRLIEKEGLLQWAEEANPELLITAGAGDIDAWVQPIKEKLDSR